MSNGTFKSIYASEVALAKNMANAKGYTGFSLRQTISQLNDIASSGQRRAAFSENYSLNPLKEKEPYVESIAAHSALTEAFFERALIEYYGEDFGEPNAKKQKTEDGYSYREAMEAARIYSLHQIQGDKSANEEEPIFYGKYVGGYGRGALFAQNVVKLLESKKNPTTQTEKMLYLAANAATIFYALSRDRNNDGFVIERGHPWLNDKEKAALIKLPTHTGNHVKVSQFLLYKYFKMDQLTLLDDTGFFTAIIIQYTLNVYGFWPAWREDDYK